MISKLAVFIDDGGVMNDNALRGPQWQRLVAEFLAPRLGGEYRAWAEANKIVAEEMWRKHLEGVLRLPEEDMVAFRDRYQIAWLREMCDLVGVTSPEEAECLALANSTTAYVVERVRSAIPGAIEAVRHLHAAGYELYTASGEHSDELSGYLEGRGCAGYSAASTAPIS